MPRTIRDWSPRSSKARRAYSATGAGIQDKRSPNATSFVSVKTRSTKSNKDTDNLLVFLSRFFASKQIDPRNYTNRKQSHEIFRYLFRVISWILSSQTRRTKRPRQTNYLSVRFFASKQIDPRNYTNRKQSHEKVFHETF